MREGSIWYVLSMKWFSKWQNYVNATMGSGHPAKIDNSDVLVDLTKEKKYLVEQRTDSLW